MNISDVKSYLEGLLELFWESLWAELANAFGRLTSDLWTAWRPILAPDVLETLELVAFPFRSARKLVDAILATGNAVQEFAQDVRLAPYRALANHVDEFIPVPDGWKTRVFRADEAVRWIFQELMHIAVEIQDMDLPFEAELAIQVKGIIGTTQAAQIAAKAEAATGATVSASVQGKIVLLVVALLKTAIAIGVALGAVIFLIRLFGKYGEEVLRDRALSQDSEIVNGRRKNLRAGPDV